MKLLSGEKVLVEIGSLLLTTHRVRYQSGHGGHSSLTSIMLENVCSIQASRQAFPWLGVLGLTSWLVAALVKYSALKMSTNTPAEALAFQGREADAQALFGLGVVLVGLYFFVRRKVIVIASGGATISCPLFGNRDSIQNFTDALEGAKDERLRMLQHPTERI
jgi:hypothetical protein